MSHLKQYSTPKKTSSTKLSPTAALRKKVTFYICPNDHDQLRIQSTAKYGFDISRNWYGFFISAYESRSDTILLDHVSCQQTFYFWGITIQFPLIHPSHSLIQLWWGRWWSSSQLTMGGSGVDGENVLNPSQYVLEWRRILTLPIIYYQLCCLKKQNTVLLKIKVMKQFNILKNILNLCM